MNQCVKSFESQFRDSICRRIAVVAPFAARFPPQGAGGAEKSRDLDLESMSVGELKEKLKSLGFMVLTLALYSVYCGSLKNKEPTLNVPRRPRKYNFGISLNYLRRDLLDRI